MDMKHNKVGSVMTTDVVRATYGTPFKEVARMLAAHRINGLPVVDLDDARLHTREQALHGVADDWLRRV